MRTTAEEISKRRMEEENNRIRMRQKSVSSEEKQKLITNALSLEMHAPKYARKAVEDERERLKNRSDLRAKRREKRIERQEERRKMIALEAPLDASEVRNIIGGRKDLPTLHTSASVDVLPRQRIAAARPDNILLNSTGSFLTVADVD